MTDMFATLDQVTRLVEEDNPDEAYRVMKDAVAQDSHGFARIFLSEWMNHLANEEESVQNKFAEILIFLKDDFPELATSESKATEEEVTASPPLAMPIWLAPFAKPEHAVAPVPVVERPAEEPSASVEPAVASAVPEESVTTAEPEVVAPEKPPVTSEPEQPVAAEKPKAVRKVKAPEPEEREHLTLTFYEWQMSAIAKAAQKEHIDEGVLLARMLETRKLEPLMWSRYRHGRTASPAHRITIAVPHKTKVTLEKDKDFEGIKTTTKYVRKILFGNRAEKS